MTPKSMYEGYMILYFVKKTILKVNGLHKVDLVQLRLHRSGFAKSIQEHGDSSKNIRKKGFSMYMRARDKTDAQ